MLNKEVSSTIFKVYGMTGPGIEPRSSGPLENTIHKAKVHIILFLFRILINPKNYSFYTLLLEQNIKWQLLQLIC